MSGKTFGRLMVAPAVLLMLIVGTVPLLYSLWLVFQRFTVAGEATFVGLGNVEALFRDRRFITSLLTTARLLVVCMALDLCLGLGIALAINQIRRFRGIVASLMLIPATLAPVVSGIIWWMLLDASSGPVNYFLKIGLGAPQIEWMAKLPWAYFSIIIATVWQWTPFVTMIFLGGLVSIPVSVLDAGRVDGATPWQGFIHITLPLMRPYIFIAALLQFIDLIKMFDVPYVLTQGGPGSATEVTGIYLYRLSFEQSANYGRGAAISWILVLLLSVITTVYLRLVGGKGGILKAD